MEAVATDSVDYAALNSLLICPYKGKVISPFGKRGGRSHTGTDVKGNKGDTIQAACCGVVTMAKTYYGYGKLIVIKHITTFETYYAHLDKMMVKVGDSIQVGQPIGLVGRTGRATTNHLHFEVRKDKKALNAENYFDFGKGLALKSPVKGLEPNVDVKYELIVSETKPVQIIQANAEQDPAPIDQETVEVPEHVIIQKGDTLYSLAKRNGTTVKELLTLNQLSSNLLKIGQILKLR